MEFIKKIFNDDSTIVGLCGFEEMKPNYNKKSLNTGVCNVIFNPFIPQKPSTFNFETNFEGNVLLL